MVMLEFIYTWELVADTRHANHTRAPLVPHAFWYLWYDSGSGNSSDNGHSRNSIDSSYPAAAAIACCYRHGHRCRTTTTTTTSTMTALIVIGCTARTALTALTAEAGATAESHCNSSKLDAELAVTMTSACARFMLTHIVRVLTEGHFASNRHALAGLVERELALQLQLQLQVQVGKHALS
jgi:hypothetical protein